MRDRQDGGQEEVAGRMLEGASRLWYAGRDAEAEAVRRLAGWVAEHRDPSDARVVERISAALTPGLVERIAASVEWLGEEGHEDEAAALAPFVALLHQMREVNAACARMQRGYRRLEAAVAEQRGLPARPRSV